MLQKEIPVKYANLSYRITENIFLRNALKVDPRKLIIFRQRSHSLICLFQSDFETALTLLKTLFA